MCAALLRRRRRRRLATTATTTNHEQSAYTTRYELSAAIARCPFSTTTSLRCCRFAALSLSRASETTAHHWRMCAICASEMPTALLLLLANHHQWQHMKPVWLQRAASAGSVCVRRCELSRQRLVLKPHQYHKLYSMETTTKGGVPQTGVCFFSPFLSVCVSTVRSRQSSSSSLSSSCPLYSSLRHPLEAWPRSGGLTTLSAFICMQICCSFELDSLGIFNAARCHWKCKYFDILNNVD